MSVSDLVESVLTLYKERKWKEIISRHHNASDKNKLSWVIPSEDNIDFINCIMKENDLDSIISVGCGSGLLEWILRESKDINMIGIEIDKCWWQCKYAPPTFISLHLADTILDNDKSTLNVLENERAAIMFCYFNNWNAFEKYIKYYTGKILIIIGPGEEKFVHTDPKPFDSKLDKSWSLIKFQEVFNTKDFIAVYKKNTYTTHINNR